MCSWKRLLFMVTCDTDKPGIFCTMSYTNNFQEDREADFNKAEIDGLRQALKRTYTERFEMMMTLIKTNLMLRKAAITHHQQPVVLKEK
jgi:hypothetical protein